MWFFPRIKTRTSPHLGLKKKESSASVFQLFFPSLTETALLFQRHPSLSAVCRAALKSLSSKVPPPTPFRRTGVGKQLCFLFQRHPSFRSAALKSLVCSIVPTAHSLPKKF
ncbi:hypothetical protein CEXT_97721 [Caerostris extrusa]|uniref:Uncharacterized protein n=1 Tax=Caerostris extrusa TaxID=172846 RepID=A0AAV4XTM2_CAEEX|nr:hypothetical protein CEXT_97721 [Caerostris extrusa]